MHEYLVIAYLFLFLRCILTLNAPNTTKADFANTVDPEETAHNEPSHLDPQCLPLSILIYKIIQFELSVFKNIADMILPSCR